MYLGAAIVAIAALVGGCAVGGAAAPITAATVEAVQLTGTLMSYSGDLVSKEAGRDDLPSHLDGTRLVTEDASYELALPGGTDAVSGDTVAVTGTVSRGTITATALQVTASRPQARASADRSSTRSVLVLGAVGAGTAAGTTSLAQVAGDINAGVNAFYQEATYGSVGFTATAGAWVQINPANNCDPTTVISLAIAAANAQGLNASGYDRVAVVFKADGSTSNGWGFGCITALFAKGFGVPGFGVVLLEQFQNGTSILNLPAYAGTARNTKLIAHEMGHSEGLWHANRAVCTGGSGFVTVSNTCATDAEYGDPFSVMGGQSTTSNQAVPDVTDDSMQAGHFSARDKFSAGWLTAAQVFMAAPVGASSGSFTLTPIETTAAGYKGARVIVSGKEYWFEIRRAIGLDSWMGSFPGAIDGVLMHAPRTVTSTTNGTSLFDGKPSTGTDLRDAAIAAGTSVTTPEGAVFTVTTSGASTATVAYSTAASLPTAPAAPGTPVASSAPGSVTVSWPAVSNWGSRPASAYVVTATSTDGQTTRTGSVASSSTTLAMTNLPRGKSYTFRVAAMNASNVAGTQSVASTVARISYDRPVMALQTITEGNVSSARPVAVGLAVAPLADISYRFFTNTGTAQPILDYTPMSQYSTVTFLAGSTTATISFGVVGDTVAEPLYETVDFTGIDDFRTAGAQSYALGTVRIRDDDALICCVNPGPPNSN